MPRDVEDRGSFDCQRAWYWASVIAAFSVFSAPPVFAQPTRDDRGTLYAIRARCEQPLARIVSVEGDASIVTRDGPTATILATTSGVDAILCPGETLRIGALSRAAVELVGTGQMLRLDQNTTLRVLRPQTPGHPIIDLFAGMLRLFSPVGRPLDVRTPFVTAGVEGTEFVVASDPEKSVASVAVIDGRVIASNGVGRVSLGPGEGVVAHRSGPPQRIDVRPRDLVRWSVYYPPALWSLPPGSRQSATAVDRAWRLYQSGDRTAALHAIEGIGFEADLDGPSVLRFAALLLSVGRVDEAEKVVGRVLDAGPSMAATFALRSVIAISRNDVPTALQLAHLASVHEPNSPAAAVALSYALQAALRLDEARSALTPLAASGDALVGARLAEIEMALGRISSARDAARGALETAPSLSRPHSILGFAALARADFETAEAEFRAAVGRDASDPVPQLGLGLIAIRRNDIDEGRRRLEIAVALDPESSVARAYLGKAYAAERRFDAADREWRLGEQSDPTDPTPYLYAAIAERSLNRPIEAIEDFNNSIARNDNLAVYRSRLLLDQDFATRTTGLATLYRDLGFEQLALNEGFKSVNTDASSPGAHRFLSDSYLALPRHETASDSELLQSLLLQPVNVLPIRPRAVPFPGATAGGLGIIDPLGPPRLSGDEFSPFFASDGVSLLVDGFGGTQKTIGGNVVASALYQNLSASAGQFYSRTSGIRENDDLQRRDTDILVQPALSERASLLGEFRFSDFNAGDPNQFFDATNFDPGARQRSQDRQYRLGGRFDASPGATIVGVWTGENLHQFQQFGSGLIARGLSDGNLGETAAYLTGNRFNIVFGGGYFSGSTRVLAEFAGFELPPNEAPEQQGDVWFYGTGRPFSDGFLKGLMLTAGASFDAYRSDTIHRNKLNPKLGFSWELCPQTTIRAAYFQQLTRRTVGGQTIEPTQVDGFNQIYDDIAGTVTRRWGIGIDHKLSSNLFLGAEWSQRRLDVPMIFVSLDGSTDTALVGWKEQFGRAYVSWMPTNQLAASIDAQWERISRPPLNGNVFQFAEINALRVPIELRWFHPMGVFSLLRATLAEEHGKFLSASGDVFSGRDVFATVDLGVGWRFPGRAMIATLEVRNLFDSGFRFQDTDPLNPQISPARLVLARVTAGF